MGRDKGRRQCGRGVERCELTTRRCTENEDAKSGSLWDDRTFSPRAPTQREDERIPAAEEVLLDRLPRDPPSRPWSAGVSVERCGVCAINFHNRRL